MKSLKILLLSSVFLFTNCSLINDKFLPRSDKTQNEKSVEQKQEIVKERVYIEDEKEEKIVQKKEVLKRNKEGLQGDTEYQNNEYPNIANVPERPDPSISLEEQDSIVKNLENNFQLQPVPSESVAENKVSNIKKTFNDTRVSKRNRSYENTKNSIKDIQISKLEQIKSFKPDASYSKNQAPITEYEEELHSLAKELKNLKTQEQIIGVEDKIKKNDLYYTPEDIEKILRIKSRKEVKVKEKNISKKEFANKQNKIEVQNIDKTITIEKKIEEREVPVARITFHHGSSQLTDEDLLKIKKVANLFYENEGKKIVIVGHASSRTNYDMDLTKHALVNFNISLERARKVMSGFSIIGLNSQRIELVAMSDTKPLYEEIMPRLEAANRRAEIFIQY